MNKKGDIMNHSQYIDAITYIMKKLSAKWGVIIHYVEKQFIVYYKKKELFRCGDVYDIEDYLKLYLS